mmetsp:Transcript_2106/g.8215  ORF Transcript_2106/g.8215 Transcript_2106/m.8215 type:complete len:320 (-) Transcript_2106:876-1835(-)
MTTLSKEMSSLLTFLAALLSIGGTCTPGCRKSLVSTTCASVTSNRQGAGLSGSCPAARASSATSVPERQRYASKASTVPPNSTSSGNSGAGAAFSPSSPSAPSDAGGATAASPSGAFGGASRKKNFTARPLRSQRDSLSKPSSCKTSPWTSLPSSPTSRSKYSGSLTGVPTPARKIWSKGGGPSSPAAALIAANSSRFLNRYSLVSVQVPSGSSNFSRKDPLAHAFTMSSCSSSSAGGAASSAGARLLLSARIASATGSSNRRKPTNFCNCKPKRNVCGRCRRGADEATNICTSACSSSAAATPSKTWSCGNHLKTCTR